jgi:hypothetical protein
MKHFRYLQEVSLVRTHFHNQQTNRLFLVPVFAQSYLLSGVVMDALGHISKLREQGGYQVFALILCQDW